jgi:hypothetical protein
MQHGLAGVCLASKDMFTMKSSILKGAPGKLAMLIPAKTEVDDPTSVIMVWVKLGEITKQLSCKLVQLGSTPVTYNPPAARGKAPVVTPMGTVVLEIPRRVWTQETDWKRAVTEACATFTAFVRPALKETEWSDYKISRCAPKVVDGRTTAMEAFARVPLTCIPAILSKSGLTESHVFARLWVDKSDADAPPQYRNLWMDTSTLSDAITKYQALPSAKVLGLAWNHKAFGVRVRTTDAPEIAPLVNGKPYVTGDRYEITGIPRDWRAEDLFQALSTTDCPWPRITEAAVIRRTPRHGAFTWVVKAPEPPSSVIVFLDEFVLSIKRYEAQRSPIPAKKTFPMPSASTWPTPNDSDMKPETEAKEGAEEVPTHTPGAPPEEKRRSRSPRSRDSRHAARPATEHVPPPPAPASSSVPASDTDRKIAELQKQISDLAAQFAQLSAALLSRSAPADNAM